MNRPWGASSRWLKTLEYGILMACLIVSTVLVLQGSGVVPKPNMDQHFVETVNIQPRWVDGQFAFQYPNLMHTGGITSSLIAGIYKIFIPTTPATLNWHFKIFAMAGHLISSFFLLRTAIPRFATLRILGFLVIATSGFQLLEPSSDVLSATLLNIFFIAVLRRWPRALTAFTLATFGLCKVELTLSAMVLSLFWWAWEWYQGSDKPYLPTLYTWLFLLIYLAPAFVFTGSNPLTSDRSSTAFFSAYGDYLRLHQFQLIPPSQVEAAKAIRETIFRDAPSFKDVLFKHPDLYFDFLGVSAARSIPNVLKVFKFMLVPYLICVSQINLIKQSKFLLIGSVLVTLCILMPSWLVIFVRMRYIAKALPLVTVATIASSIELSHRKKWPLPFLWVCGIGTIGWQLLSITPFQD